MGIPIFLITVLLVGIAVLLVFVAALKYNKKAKKTDYRAFFVMGICFLPLGIVMFVTIGNPGMLGITALGAVYMSMGLSNKDKWENKKKKRKK